MKKYVFTDHDIIEKIILMLASPEVLKDSLLLQLIAI